MAKHIEIGRLGESKAHDYLTAQQYTIVEQNWRWGKGEIDIIAWSPEKILVFVEVKTRTTNKNGYPETAVSSKKQTLFYELATEYMYRIRYEGEIRFDIIAITLEPQLDIQHYEDAFFPSW